MWTCGSQEQGQELLSCTFQMTQFSETSGLGWFVDASWCLQVWQWPCAGSKGQLIFQGAHTQNRWVKSILTPAEWLWALSLFQSGIQWPPGSQVLNQPKTVNSISARTAGSNRKQDKMTHSWHCRNNRYHLGQLYQCVDVLKQPKRDSHDHSKSPSSQPLKGGWPTDVTHRFSGDQVSEHGRYKADLMAKHGLEKGCLHWGI